MALLAALCASNSCTVHVSDDDDCDHIHEDGCGHDHPSLAPPPQVIELLLIDSDGEMQRGYALIPAE